MYLFAFMVRIFFSILGTSIASSKIIFIGIDSNDQSAVYVRIDLDEYASSILICQGSKLRSGNRFILSAI